MAQEKYSETSAVGEAPVNGTPEIVDPALEALRDILLSRNSHRLDHLEADLAGLREQTSDRDALIAVITPILGDIIRQKIRDSRQEMIEALYPIIGETVIRAVTEAIQDLRRSIDAQMRGSFRAAPFGRRIRARLTGVSDSDLLLRDSLPFEVVEIFLIHRETGLLLNHLSPTLTPTDDSDLVSGMLTAIRDFVRDAFAAEGDGELDQIQYSDNYFILIEAAQLVYLAVAIKGTQPAGFQAQLRERIIEINHRFEHELRHFDGDVSPLAGTGQLLQTLLSKSEPSPPLSAGQKRFLAWSAASLLICSLLSCGGGYLAWQRLSFQPTPVVLVVTATALPSATPSPTPSATPTATNTPTVTPTATATPSPTPSATATPNSVAGIMTGSVWLREVPDPEAPRLGKAIELGQPVTVLAGYGNWLRVSQGVEGNDQVSGWVPARWVGTLEPIPEWLITPTP